jgi:hypothetical protein
LEEAVEKEHQPKTKTNPDKSKIFESSDNQPHIPSTKSNLHDGLMNGEAATMRGGLAPYLPDNRLPVDSYKVNLEAGKLNGIAVVGQVSSPSGHKFYATEYFQLARNRNSCGAN